MNVICVLDNLFEELEALGTIDILKRGGINVKICSLHGENSITGAHGITLKDLSPFSLEEAKKFDALFIAGGPHYISLEKDTNFLSLCKYFMETNKKVGAICAAPTILGHLGLLKGYNYTCFNSMNEDFKGTFIDHYAVNDRNLTTGKGPMATIEFALLFLEKLVNKDTAEIVKNQAFYYNK